MSLYRQQNPYYPPPQAPEQEYDEYEYDDGEYYEETEGDSVAQRLLIFISGGCLVFICMGCCVLLFSGLWILDPGSGLVETPPAGSDIGLTYEEPAFPDETIVNEEQLQLSILEFNRSVAVPGYVPAADQELVVVTIELVNVGDEEVGFSESDFILINAFEEAYEISSSASLVDGALGRGNLRPDEGIEGRLTFEVLIEDVSPDLVLRWESSRNVAPRYIYVQ